MATAGGRTAATGAEPGPIELVILSRAEELLKEGNVELKAGNYAAADSQYTLALAVLEQLPPELRVLSFELHGNRSEARTHLARIGSAAEDAERCISMDPAREHGYVRLGEALEQGENLGAACRAYQLGLHHIANSRTLLRKMGLAKLKLAIQEHHEHKSRSRGRVVGTEGHEVVEGVRAPNEEDKIETPGRQQPDRPTTTRFLRVAVEIARGSNDDPKKVDYLDLTVQALGSFMSKETACVMVDADLPSFVAAYPWTGPLIGRMTETDMLQGFNTSRVACERQPSGHLQFKLTRSPPPSPTFPPQSWLHPSSSGLRHKDGQRSADRRQTSRSVCHTLSSSASQPHKQRPQSSGKPPRAPDSSSIRDRARSPGGGTDPSRSPSGPLSPNALLRTPPRSAGGKRSAGSTPIGGMSPPLFGGGASSKGLTPLAGTVPAPRSAPPPLSLDSPTAPDLSRTANVSPCASAQRARSSGSFDEYTTSLAAELQIPPRPHSAAPFDRASHGNPLILNSFDSFAPTVAGPAPAIPSAEGEGAREDEDGDADNDGGNENKAFTSTDIGFSGATISDSPLGRW